MTWELSISIVGIALLIFDTVLIYRIWEILEDDKDEREAIKKGGKHG